MTLTCKVELWLDWYAVLFRNYKRCCTCPFAHLHRSRPKCIHSILGCLEVEIRRNSSLLTHDHNFGERTNARASLPMSHVALDAAEVERSLSSLKTRQKDGLDGVELSRVSSLRPCSMCFHIRHIF